MRRKTTWKSLSPTRWRRHLVPIAVWLGALGAVGWLAVHRTERSEWVGTALGAERRLTAPLDGRLRTVGVKLFKPVTRGQTLAVMESDRIRARRALAEAEVERLREELSDVVLGLASEAESLRRALARQQLRIDQLVLEESMLVLRSPQDGVVCELLRGAGETIRAGETILTVTTSRPTEVVAYATEEQVGGLHTNMVVRVSSTIRGHSKSRVATRILAIGPAIRRLPARMWRSPSIPEWGWPVRIALPSELGIRSGERVWIEEP